MNQTNLNLKEMSRISKGIYLIDNKYSLEQVIEKIEENSSFQINELYGMVNNQTGEYINHTNLHHLSQNIQDINGMFGFAESFDQMKNKFSKLLHKNNAIILSQKINIEAIKSTGIDIETMGEYIGKNSLNQKNNQDDLIFYHIYEVSLKHDLKNKKTKVML